MKRTAIIMFAVCLAAWVMYAKSPEKGINLEYAQPTFDDSAAKVIDLFSVNPRPEDNIVVECSYNVKGTFRIYYHDPAEQKWKPAAEVVIDSYTGSKKADVTVHDIFSYRYFAVVAGDGVLYSYSVSSHHNDLYITAESDQPVLINGQVVDAQNIKVIHYSGAEDFIKFSNNSSSSNFTLSVYLFDSRKQQWLSAGTARLKETGDADTVDMPYSGDLNRYKYCAVGVQKDFHFRYESETVHNDLMITVFDDKEIAVRSSEVSKTGIVPVAFTKPFSKTIMLSEYASHQIKVRNFSDAENKTYVVYGYDPSCTSWRLLGAVNLAGFGDVQTVDTPYADHLNLFYEYALESRDKRDFDITFTTMDGNLNIDVTR